VNQLVERKLDDLARLCEKFRVKRLDLFGSATTDLFDPQTSDLDFLVSFRDPGPDGYAETYFGLQESLQELFQRHVDLVMESAIKNPYFRQEVEKTRTLLYGT
jgi:predicted nucleotidyltransferase